MQCNMLLLKYFVLHYVEMELQIIKLCNYEQLQKFCEFVNADSSIIVHIVLPHTVPNVHV